MLPKHYVKTGALAVALVVLVVEGVFVYRWYERYYGNDAAVYSASAGNPAVQDTVERAGSKAVRDDGEADSGETTFAHTATDESSSANSTYLSHPDLDGNPNAVVLAKAPGYGHNKGVWYDSAGAKRWAIFNQDRAAMSTGTNFEVTIPPDSESFVHRAEPANIYGNVTYLDNPLTNGKPDASLSYTQNWNPGGGAGVYNDHPVGVAYDADVQKWALYNTDGAPIPDGAAFNVAVSKSAESAAKSTTKSAG